MSSSEILMLVHKNHWMNELSMACSNIVKICRNILETSIEDGWWWAGLVEALLSPLTRHLPLISAGYRTPAICCISSGWIVAFNAGVLPRYLPWWTGRSEDCGNQQRDNHFGKDRHC